MWLLIVLIILSTTRTIIMDDAADDLERKNQITQFLKQYNSQWPFLGVTFVHSTFSSPDVNRETVRNKTAMEITVLNKWDHILFNTFSEMGISASSIHLPLPPGTQIATKLNINGTTSSLVTLILFADDKLDSQQNTFLRQISEAGLMSGKVLNWIIISSDAVKLSPELGLRPDSHVTVVAIDTNQASISRWTGTKQETVANMNMLGEIIQPSARSKGPLELKGQQISVALFEDYPFTYVDQNDGKIKGWCMDIWEELQFLLQFKCGYSNLMLSYFVTVFMIVDACKASEVRVMLLMEFIIQPIPVVNEVKVSLGEYDSEHFSGLGILICNIMSAQWGKERKTTSLLISASRLIGVVIGIIVSDGPLRSSYYVIQSSTSAGLFRQAAQELWLGRADAVIGSFAMTENDAIDFSEPVTLLSYRFYMQRATTQSSWRQYIQPFTPTMWLAVCFTVVINTIFLATSYLIGRHFGLEDLSLGPIYNWKESAIVVFGSLLQQGPDYFPNGFGAALILWSSYVFGLIVYTAYGAALISKLTVRYVYPPFNDLNGFLQTSNYILYMLPDSAPHRLLLSAESGAWGALRERRPAVELIQSVDRGVDIATYNSRAIFLDARERVNFAFQQAPLNCYLTQLPEDVLRLAGRFIFQKNSPFKNAIDQQLNKMSITGRLKRWREYWMGGVKDNPCPADTTLPKFGLTQVILPFGIFAFGIVFSFLLLGMEISFKRLFPHHHLPHDVTALQLIAKNASKKRKVKKENNKIKPKPEFPFLQ